VEKKYKLNAHLRNGIFSANLEKREVLFAFQKSLADITSILPGGRQINLLLTRKLIKRCEIQPVAQPFIVLLKIVHLIFIS
jgi:hypothetical protein